MLDFSNMGGLKPVTLPCDRAWLHHFNFSAHGWFSQASCKQTHELKKYNVSDDGDEVQGKCDSRSPDPDRAACPCLNPRSPALTPLTARWSLAFLHAAITGTDNAWLGSLEWFAQQVLTRQITASQSVGQLEYASRTVKLKHTHAAFADWRCNYSWRQKSSHGWS